MYVTVIYIFGAVLFFTEAEEAVKNPDGHWFGSRVIRCEIYDDDKFNNNDYSH